MATRAIRTGIDPVNLESDFTKYNFGIKDLWEGLVPKYEGSPLQAQGISLESIITPPSSVLDVVSVIGETTSGGGSEGATTGGSQSQTTSGSFTGFGSAAGAAAKGATSAGLSFAGAPATVGNIAGGLIGAAVSKGEVTEADIVDIGSKAIVGAFFGNPAVTALSAVESISSLLGVNGPIAALQEALGLTSVTPGYEGGLFGSPGRGTGISGGVPGSSSADAGQTPGYDPGDLGQGIGLGTAIGLSNQGQLGGLQAAMDGAFPGMETTVSVTAEADPAADPAAEAAAEAAAGADADSDSDADSDPDSDADSDSDASGDDGGSGDGDE